MTETANSEPHNGDHFRHLKCCNMFPRQYDNFEQMARDIKRINDLGFNAVWINPIMKTGKIARPDWGKYEAGLDLPERDKKKTQSLYAMKDPFFINPEFSNVPHSKDKFTSDEAKNSRNIVAVQKLTKTIRDKGMSAMCDIAFSHVSLDAPIVEGKSGIEYKDGEKDGEKIDTTRWFKHYQGEGKLAGKPVMEGIDINEKINANLLQEDGTANTKMVWADIAKFDYSDPEIRAEIIEYFWKPYIDFLTDLGFTGIRLDSVAQNREDILEPVLSYFKEQVHQKHGIKDDDIIILGETLGDEGVDEFAKSEQITHAYSSVQWAPGLLDGSDGKAARDLSLEHTENGHNWVSKNIGDIGHFVTKGGNGAIGYPGSHDETTIVDHFIQEGYTLNPEEFHRIDNTKSLVNLSTGTITAPDGTVTENSLEELKELIDIEAAERAMREKMAYTTLLPNGGYFLFAGDEYLQAGPRSVFKDHEKGASLGDLTDLVKDINRISDELPTPARGAWSARRIGDIRDDLVVIEKHSSEGFNEVTDIIITSAKTKLDAEQDILTQEDIEAIAGAIFIKNMSANGHGDDKKHPSAEDLALALNKKGTEISGMRIHTDSRIQLCEELQQAHEGAELNPVDSKIANAPQPTPRGQAQFA